MISDFLKNIYCAELYSLEAYVKIQSVMLLTGLSCTVLISQGGDAG